MVKSGKFQVSPGSTAGRIGEGLGKGLAESIPKEAAQYRLSQGLKNFSKEAANLNPLEAATKLFSIPGVTPQMVQTLPQLLQQQQLAQSLGRAEQVPEFPTLPVKEENVPTSGLTTREAQEALRKGFKRKTPQQIDARAAELYNSNPARFKNNPELAIQYAQQEAATDEAAYQDLLNKRAGEQKLQSGVQSNLQTQAQLLGAKSIPGDVFSKIEQKSLKAVLPKEEGGEGLTDEESKIKYGKELQDVARQYNDLRAVGNWTLPTQKPSEIMRNLKSIREKFKERDDLRNLADNYIADNGLSPSKAYYLAYPVSDTPELNKVISKIPDVNPVTSASKGYLETKQTDYNPDAILEQIMPTLLKKMGSEGSPLSVAEELSMKGYDPSRWLDYLNQNRNKLTGEQADQLNKPQSFYPNLNDIWLFKLSGQNKVVE